MFRLPPDSHSMSQNHVDYRLARSSVLTSYRQGVLDRTDVCDAHPELVRAAREVGSEVDTRCPICDDDRLVHVTYVFGPRLPSHGRCITLRGELTRLAKRPGVHVAYVVEVCRSCSWNHLVRRSTLEAPGTSGPSGPTGTAGTTANGSAAGRRASSAAGPRAVDDLDAD